MEEKEFVIRRGFRDNSPRKLVINPGFISFEDSDRVTVSDTRLEKDSISDYRFGMRWIRFRIVYGRKYEIFIRNNENKVIRIVFKSYFGRKKQELHMLYNEILDRLWEGYFTEIIEDYIKRHKSGEIFSVGSVLFNGEGVTISTGIFDKTKVLIHWENVRTRNYATYFSIYSSENPSKINRGYSYLDDWNTAVLYSVLRTMLREKGIEKY
ncbi:MAG: hypothetical protein QM710_03030 [Flavobacterium sp.]